MDISSFMSSKTGSYLISMVLGFGLATLVTGTCRGAQCTVLKAPDPQAYEQDTFKYDGRCWRFSSDAASCNSKRAIVDYA